MTTATQYTAEEIGVFQAYSDLAGPSTRSLMALNPGLVFGTREQEAVASLTERGVLREDGGKHYMTPDGMQEFSGLLDLVLID